MLRYRRLVDLETEAGLRWQINVSINDFLVLLKQTTAQTLIDLLLGEEVGHHCIHL